VYNAALKKADAFINIGVVNHQLISNFNKNIPNQYIFNGLEQSQINTLLKVKPAIEKNVFFMIANFISVDRAKTKGIDIALSAYKLFREKYDIESELIIAGKVNKEIMNFLYTLFDKNFIKSINFIGEVNNLSDFFTNCTFGLNLSRYDSWSMTVNECFVAGIPCLVSENTGSKVLAADVNNKLIVKEEVNEITKRMYWLCNMNSGERKNLSEKGKKVAIQYTKEKAIQNFQEAFSKIIYNII
jgi:glycosyltransferase involved in cell wall biosynthesis